MNMFELMTEVLSIWEDSPSFYRIENKDGKVWLMPVRRLRTAMHLYQPSGRNGKLLKRWFPLLHRLPLLKQKLHIETTRCSLAEDLYDKLCKLFNRDRLEFAVFCGTPCVHQKLTIQLSSGDNILGYCKVSDSKEVAELFSRESNILGKLYKAGVHNVPKIMYAGEWRNGVYMLVQTTRKTDRSQVIHDWGHLHDGFLRDMAVKTKQRLVFEETDYYKTLNELSMHLDWLPSDEGRELVRGVLEKVLNEHKHKMVEYGAYHADFTPWNTFVEQGELFVFDWEYAQMTYPPMLDRYHFFTQTAIFEKHWHSDEIMAYVESAEGDWIDKTEYQFYLLDIIARFTLRERGHFSGDVTHSINVWTETLKRLEE